MDGYRHITVSPLGACGAEITGVNINAGADRETVAEIRRALLEHLVVFFRDQDFGIPEHRAFTRCFGQQFVHPNFDLGQPDPDIVFIDREPGDLRIVGEDWHADTTMMPAPPMGAILHALDVPGHGGDTLFANQYMAFEALSPALQEQLSTLRAVHNDTRTAGPATQINQGRTSKSRQDADWRPTQSVHPVVRVHPETGRPSLFVNAVYVHRFEGMTAEESAPLLGYLYAHACQPEFTCRFQWRPGSVAFWDNRCLVHLAVHDSHQQARRMRRTQLEGGPVEAVSRAA